MFRLIKGMFKLTATVVGLGLFALGVPALVSWGGSYGRIHSPVAEVPPTDVTMVMGAAVWGGRPSPYLQARLDVAAELYHQGKTKVIIVSGSTSDNEPATMRKYLIAKGVNELDIVLDEGGDDSYRSCARARQKFGVDKLIVVSQDYHVPRTVTTCRMVGIDAIGAPDTTRDHNQQWKRYVARELGANVKMLIDVLTKADPGITEPSSAVRDALARPR